MASETTIRCDIVSAEAQIYSGEAVLVVATGEVGELGIAPKHAPLITRLKPGKVVVTTPSGEHLDFAISGGMLEVQWGEGTGQHCVVKYQLPESAKQQPVNKVSERCQ